MLLPDPGETRCSWFSLDELSCPNPATHIDPCDGNLPFCVYHACRRAITFEEAARRAEAKRMRDLPTPLHWMAL